MNTCYKCSSTSVILDGRSWVCAEHILPCQCDSKHDTNNDWDFNQSRSFGIGITVRGLEYQMPAPDVPGYDTDGNWTGEANPLPKWADLDRSKEPDVIAWVENNDISEDVLRTEPEEN